MVEQSHQTIGKQEACLGHVRGGRDGTYGRCMRLAIHLPFGQWRARETHGESEGSIPEAVLRDRPWPWERADAARSLLRAAPWHGIVPMVLFVAGFLLSVAC